MAVPLWKRGAQVLSLRNTSDLSDFGFDSDSLPENSDAEDDSGDRLEGQIGGESPLMVHFEQFLRAHIEKEVHRRRRL